MTPQFRFGGRMWIWVAGGVAWGLLCVGVRVASLGVGREMNELAARRHELLSRVQSLERRVAQSGQMDQLEKTALAQGFSKPGPGQIVIVAPVKEGGVLERFSRLVGLSREEPATRETAVASKRNAETGVSAKRRPATTAKRKKKAVKR